MSSTTDKKLFKNVQRLVAKEYFRVIGWDVFAKNNQGIPGKNTKMWVTHSYKIGSLVYQLFFGQTYLKF